MQQLVVCSMFCLDRGGARRASSSYIVYKSISIEWDTGIGQHVKLSHDAPQHPARNKAHSQQIHLYSMASSIRRSGSGVESGHLKGYQIGS